jgi:F0F1-type ATP synthase assembly protein I
MNPAVRIVLVQAGIGAASSAMFFFIDPAAGSSAVMAMFCVLVPTSYFAWRHASTFNAARALAHGVMKTVLTVMLLTVCIAIVGIEPKGFFVTFALMQLGYLMRVS